jgi:hypothetical protein
MGEPISSLSPFRWKGTDYNVVQCEFVEGKPCARVEPANAELEDALVQRVLVMREKVYIGFGFKCFQTDYGHG